MARHGCTPPPYQIVTHLLANNDACMRCFIQPVLSWPTCAAAVCTIFLACILGALLSIHQEFWVSQ